MKENEITKLVFIRTDNSKLADVVSDFEDAPFPKSKLCQLDKIAETLNLGFKPYFVCRDHSKREKQLVKDARYTCKELYLGA